MVQKIALEEHFLCPGFIEYWNPTVAQMPAAKREGLLSRCTDFGELRLASMDKAGIARAVLSACVSHAIGSASVPRGVPVVPPLV